MKNKELINSFNLITPSKEEKEKMLDNVLKNSEMKAIPFNKFLSITLLIILVLVLNTSNKLKEEKNNMKIVKASIERLNFIFNGKCYQESDIVSDNNNLVKLGITSRIENDKLQNIAIYRNNNNNIFLEINDYYIMFEENNCLKEIRN